MESRKSVCFMIRDRIFRFRIVDREVFENSQSALPDDAGPSYRIARLERPSPSPSVAAPPFLPTPSIATRQSCPFCFRVYTVKNLFDAHVRSHSMLKTYQCAECTKSFSRAANYQAHMRLHASGKRHFCSFCGKWFRDMSSMLEHQQLCVARQQGEVIPTERPLRYQCSFCEKMFHQRRDKTIHERTHTGIRPYSCGYCYKSFTQSQALTVHIRKHTNEKPFSCSICGHQFTDSSALRKHEFNKHPTFPDDSSIFDPHRVLPPRPPPSFT